MPTPPLFSTFSAVTELLVTAAVVWFFYNALKKADYRWGVITAALIYETLFNITYMVSRLALHTSSTDVERPGWYIGFVAFHGTLSLVMFLGLIALVVWAYERRKQGMEDPLGAHRKLSWTFLVLWFVSIGTGELIYIMQWTGASTV